MTIRSGRCLRGREGPLRVRWPNGMRERRTSRSTSMRESGLRIRRARGWVHTCVTMVAACVSGTCAEPVTTRRRSASMHARHQRDMCARLRHGLAPGRAGPAEVGGGASNLQERISGPHACRATIVDACVCASPRTTIVEHYGSVGCACALWRGVIVGAASCVGCLVLYASHMASCMACFLRVF